jgi:MFS family permease
MGSYRRGIRINRGQFALQILQVFLVGLMAGLERSALPALGRSLGLAPDAFFLLASFLISFGLVKGALNSVAGTLADRWGRKRVLLIGWLAGLPIPLMLWLAPTWGCILVANALLGFQQGFTWTMTVTSQIDLADSRERGLAVGINEATGYVGVGLAGFLTGALATAIGARAGLALFSLSVVVLALLSSLTLRETLFWAHAEGQQAPSAPEPLGRAFVRISFLNTSTRALCQGGVANKIADAFVWALLPILLRQEGLSPTGVGEVVGLYGAIWGLNQLWTGHLSDRIGRKGPIVAGFLLLVLSLAALGWLRGRLAWFLDAGGMGLGMALLYPNLIAAVSDVIPAQQRGQGLGVYRYWRDTGYAIGGLVLGGVAQISQDLRVPLELTALLVALSGLWIALTPLR